MEGRREQKLPVEITEILKVVVDIEGLGGFFLLLSTEQWCYCLMTVQKKETPLLAGLRSNQEI